PDDAEHPARRAVPAEAGGTEHAVAAREVDVADDAAADQRRVARGLDAADPLVPERAPDLQVAARDLEVRAADAREGDADERVTLRGRRRCCVARKRQPG